MRVFTAVRAARWAQGVGLVALAALAWEILVANDLFWSAIVVTSVVGTALTTAAVIRSRSVPTLADVIASAEAESAIERATPGRAPRGPRGN